MKLHSASSDTLQTSRLSFQPTVLANNNNYDDGRICREISPGGAAWGLHRGCGSVSGSDPQKENENRIQARPNKQDSINIIETPQNI